MALLAAWHDDVVSEYSFELCSEGGDCALASDVAVVGFELYSDGWACLEDVVFEGAGEEREFHFWVDGCVSVGWRDPGPADFETSVGWADVAVACAADEFAGLFVDE